jgi:hypothetical protein
MDLITWIKTGVYTLLGWITSMVFYFAPVHGLMIALSVAFFGSFIFGIIAGTVVQKEDVSLRKASVAFSEFANYLLILAALFVIGDKMDSKDLVYQVLTWITWGMIYFYIANWTKNLKRLFPSSRFFDFLWFILNLEFVKKFPFLKQFQEHEYKNKKNNEL